MSRLSSQAHQQILGGLLQDPDDLALYQQSAYFKTAMDTLVSMLPAWVDGLADQAEEADKRLQQAYEAMLHGLPLDAFSGRVLKTN